MDRISERDVVSAIGAADELILRETLRTEARLREFRRALALVAGPANGETAEHRRLTPRMRRLVDLLSVAEESPQAQHAQTAIAAWEAGHRAA